MFNISEQISYGKGLSKKYWQKQNQPISLIILISQYNVACNHEGANGTFFPPWESNLCETGFIIVLCFFF